ncbi:MAG TPA: TatD family hydrolase [Myxococcales bacterium]|nr:TatD family hydrolase [Myxococcales bacterium]
MAKDPPPFVDLHLHAEGVSDADLTTLCWFGLRAAVTCAHDAGAATAEELRRHWDELVRVQVRRLEGAGIRPWVALAVHPARIPWHGVDDLLHRLPRYFDDPHVAALGELGLHHGGEREEELLARQLELSSALRKPVIVHTPANAKAAVTRRLLALLRESRVEPTRVLVDHVTNETFQLVRACGYFAGLTLQPGLLEPTEAAQLISRHGTERVVLTSDIGEGASDLLALPRAADALRKAGLSEELVRRALYEGPLSFLGAAAE